MQIIFIQYQHTHTHTRTHISKTRIYWLSTTTITQTPTVTTTTPDTATTILEVSPSSSYLSFYLSHNLFIYLQHSPFLARFESGPLSYHARLSLAFILIVSTSFLSPLISLPIFLSGSRSSSLFLFLLAQSVTFIKTSLISRAYFFRFFFFLPFFPFLLFYFVIF